MPWPPGSGNLFYRYPTLDEMIRDPDGRKRLEMPNRPVTLDDVLRDPNARKRLMMGSGSGGWSEDEYDPGASIDSTPEAAVPEFIPPPFERQDLLPTDRATSVLDRSSRLTTGSSPYGTPANLRMLVEYARQRYPDMSDEDLLDLVSGGMPVLSGPPDVMGALKTPEGQAQFEELQQQLGDIYGIHPSGPSIVEDPGWKGKIARGVANLAMSYHPAEPPASVVRAVGRGAGINGRAFLENTLQGIAQAGEQRRSLASVALGQMAKEAASKTTSLPEATKRMTEIAKAEDAARAAAEDLKLKKSTTTMNAAHAAFYDAQAAASKSNVTSTAEKSAILAVEKLMKNSPGTIPSADTYMKHAAGFAFYNIEPGQKVPSMPKNFTSVREDDKGNMWVYAPGPDNVIRQKPVLKEGSKEQARQYVRPPRATVSSSAAAAAYASQFAIPASTQDKADAFDKKIQKMTDDAMDPKRTQAEKRAAWDMINTALDNYSGDSGVKPRFTEFKTRLGRPPHVPTGGAADLNEALQNFKMGKGSAPPSQNEEEGP